MTGQLTLPLASRPARGREDFRVSAANADAVAMIDAWRDWPDLTLVLTGPEGVGKTHLAHVWMAASGAEKIAAAALSPDDAPALVAARAVVVEDADRIGAEAETGLFHLLNLARAEGCALLITGTGAPRDWRLKTPDLVSRLRGATAVALQPPDDALLAALFVKHFSDRGVAVREPVIDYLIKRIERSAVAVAATVERLDRAALAAKRPITIPFVRSVGWM